MYDIKNNIKPLGFFQGVMKLCSMMVLRRQSSQSTSRSCPRKYKSRYIYFKIFILFHLFSMVLDTELSSVKWFKCACENSLNCTYGWSKWNWGIDMFLRPWNKNKTSWKKRTLRKKTLTCGHGPLALGLGYNQGWNFSIIYPSPAGVEARESH